MGLKTPHLVIPESGPKTLGFTFSTNGTKKKKGNGRNRYKKDMGHFKRILR